MVASSFSASGLDHDAWRGSASILVARVKTRRNKYEPRTVLTTSRSYVSSAAHSPVRGSADPTLRSLTSYPENLPTGFRARGHSSECPIAAASAWCRASWLAAEALAWQRRSAKPARNGDPTELQKWRDWTRETCLIYRCNTAPPFTKVDDCGRAGKWLVCVTIGLLSCLWSVSELRC
jgi:hypothetical protein